MRTSILAGVMVVLTATVPVAAVAQQPDARPAGGRVDQGPPPDRARLEQRFKERLAAVVQKRLGLNDDEMRRMTEVNQKYDVKRREFVQRERTARIAMRRELMGGGAPNDEHLEQLLQELSRIQHERLDLVDAEQADLAKFLTPTQRAQYLGIEEQIRRQVENMRTRPPIMDDSSRFGERGRRRRPPP